MTAASSTSIDMVLGTTSGASCNTLPTGDFSDNPSFSVGPTDLSLTVSGGTFTAYDASVSGTFDSDCAGTTDGDIQAELDMRELAPVVARAVGSDDPDYLCALLGEFGVTCAACTSDGESYCIGMHVEDIVGTETDPLSCM